VIPGEEVGGGEHKRDACATVEQASRLFADDRCSQARRLASAHFKEDRSGMATDLKTDPLISVEEYLEGEKLSEVQGGRRASPGILGSKTPGPSRAQ